MSKNYSSNFSEQISNISGILQQSSKNWSLLNMSSQTTPINTEPASPVRPSLEDIMNEYWEYRWSQGLGIYLIPIIIVLGTIGNALSFLVLSRRTMRITSTCVFMLAIAVADTTVLYFSAMRRWLILLNKGSDITTKTSSACKVFHFLSYFTFDYSVWLIVAMTIERFIAIHFPLKAVRMATCSRAKKVIVLIFFIFIAYNCHIFWTVTIDDREYCVPGDDYLDFHDKIWPWMDAAAYSFIPFAVLITLNILIIRDNKIATQNRRSMHSRYNNGNVSRNISREQFHQKITVMLLSVSFAFLICSCPKVIFISIREYVFPFVVDGKVNYAGYASYLLASRISDIFIYLNHSINFLLYSIHGQRFRRELNNLLHCRKSDLRRMSTISLSLDGTVNSSRNVTETNVNNSINPISSNSLQQTVYNESRIQSTDAENYV